MTEKSSPWQIVGGRARLRTPFLQTEINLRLPREGVSGIVYDGCPVEQGQLFQLSRGSAVGNQDALIEHYARGCDLITTYASSSPRATRSQVYWRAIGIDDRVTGLELIVSMQTSQLDGDPTLISRSLVAASKVWCLRPGRAVFDQLPLRQPSRWTGDEAGAPVAFLFRWSQFQLSYLQMADPADLGNIELGGHQETLGLVQLRYELFPERIEKGVIRRARMQGLLLPAKDDQTIATECWLRMAAASPPLTT